MLASRTSDRSAAGLEGALALGARVGAEVIGTAGDPREGGWEEDLAGAHDGLATLGDVVRDAVAAGERPLLLAGDCSICLGTLPAVWDAHPTATLLWLDAHPDLHTPASTPSGFLGGMCLGASVGRWDAGLGTGPELADVRFVDARDAEGAERDAIGAARLELPADLSQLSGPVFVHLDLDVLDPEVLPATFPAPGGLSLAQLRDLLADVAARCDIIGAEVTSAVPELAEELAGAIEPLVDVLRGPLRQH